MLHEFLKLLQMVEGGRACDGKECVVVPTGAVEMAKGADDLRRSHLPTSGMPCDAGVSCPTCQKISRNEIAVRETLHSNGVDFPMGLLESQPEP